MRIHTISILVFAMHLPGLCNDAQTPRDIRTFAANAEACEHLGGEYDGGLPANEKRTIERNVRKYCGAASSQLPTLRTRYKHDPAMLEVIRRLANEAVTDYR
jgi:uncharacterized protein (UPF0147 family)